MRRLLVVAGDRALTRFVSESLLARPIDTAAQSSDPWDISRAHTALEAQLLITHGGRPFDVFLLDQSLPDEPLLTFLGRIHRDRTTGSSPVFVMTERGRDPHIRRVAAEQFGVIGFIEKPVTEESLRHSLGSLERRRRILLIDSDPELNARYAAALGKAGYLVETARRGREAIDRAPRFRPDIVVSSLLIEDMRGADVCVELKTSRAHAGIPVVLYGQAAALSAQEIRDNAQRADDFVQAPFDDGLLVERIASLVGRAITVSAPRPPLGMSDSSVDIHPATPAPPSTMPNGETSIAPFPETQVRAAVGQRLPPRSASPSAVAPTQRRMRRVPCHFSMSIRNGGKVYTSQTLDISHGGIFLATEEMLQIGELIDMTFQLPDSNHAVEAVGRVAWQNTGAQPGTPIGFGVKFSRIDPSDLQLIVDYVNRVSNVVYSPSC
ncbi:MAG: response regulator [Deltaproteobacteria bacterium]|nr:response regulator [Deltaproteobacteria bacterium]